MAEQKKDKVDVKDKVPSRTNILRYRPKEYDTHTKKDDGKRKYPPKTL